MHWIPFLTCSAIVAAFQAVVILTALRSLLNTPMKTTGWTDGTDTRNYCVGGWREVKVPLAGKELTSEREWQLVFPACILLCPSMSLLGPAIAGWTGSVCVVIGIGSSPVSGALLAFALALAYGWFSWILGAGSEATP